MSFLKKIGSGTKKIGKKVGSKAKSAGKQVVKGAEKGWDKAVDTGEDAVDGVVQVSKDTYKTTRHLGGKLGGTLGDLAGKSFSGILAALAKILVIGFVYLVAFVLGLMLAVFLQTNSVEVQRTGEVVACEIKADDGESWECKCSRPICRTAYPAECSTVRADANACDQPGVASDSGGGAAEFLCDFWVDESWECKCSRPICQTAYPAECSSVQADASACDQSGVAGGSGSSSSNCQPALTDAEVFIGEISILGGNRAIVTFVDHIGYLDYYDGLEYSRLKYMVDNVEFTDCYKRGNTIECRGPALPSSTPNKKIPVKVLGASKALQCVDPKSGKPFDGYSCNFIKSTPNLPNRDRYLRQMDIDCPVYSTSIDSSRITLADLKPVSVQFWADSLSIYQGDCTTIHWEVGGDAKSVAFAVPAESYSTYDAGRSGSYKSCPMESTKAELEVRDINDGLQYQFLYIQVQPPRTGVELASVPNRCSLFTSMDMSVVYLDWLSGGPLQFYFKMPGGVPGLEKNIPGDTDAWEYTAQVGDYTTKNCQYEGYKERLYCSLSLPSGYSNAVRSLTLKVNGCDAPVYSDQQAYLPGIEKATGSGAGDSGNACGPSPLFSSGSCSSWCTCMGGSLDLSCGGSDECVAAPTAPCSSFCSIP